MVVFYKPQQSQSKPLKSFEASCSDLDLMGRGVCRTQERIWFVQGLIPGESARLKPVTVNDTVGTASVLKLLKPSPLRRSCDCPYQEQCGGCPLQHLPLKTALEAKIKGIKILFKKQCRLDLREPDFIIDSSEFNYRRACRLAVKADHGKSRLGFRGAFSQQLVPIDECKVLSKRLNMLIEPLTSLINSLEGRRSAGHVELLDSDGAAGVLLRMTSPLSAADNEKIKDFQQKHKAVVSVLEPFQDFMTREEILKERVVAGDPQDLYLKLGESDEHKLFLTMQAFVQVNAAVNRALTAKVCAQVNPQPEQKYLDLFCGMGNFSFPLALTGAQVSGVDIAGAMVRAANANAQKLRLSNLRFEEADLEDPKSYHGFGKSSFDAVILDPGRSGAKRACNFLGKLKVPKIVMISCNPTAASRDALSLLEDGYTIKSWGVLDMFPRTAHVEMMVVFER